MAWPAARLTYAFFQSCVRPSVLPNRRDLPGSLTTCTALTFTSNINSTACLMSTLVASRRTRKVYWLWFCIASEVFSVTCGASRTFINCSRFISPPPAGVRRGSLRDPVHQASQEKSLEALLEHLYGAPRDQHLVVSGECDGVDTGGLHHFDIGQVAGCQEQLLVGRFHD